MQETASFKAKKKQAAQPEAKPVQSKAAAPVKQRWSP
jgi:hypothetical protein